MSVAPTISDGISAEPSQSRAVTRLSVSHRGVSIGDCGRRIVVRLDVDDVGEVTERVAAGARARQDRSDPGSVRMSTSSDTWSGITLVLVPPCATVGANVVWVHAWNVRGEPEREVDDGFVDLLGVEQQRS